MGPRLGCDTYKYLHPRLKPFHTRMKQAAAPPRSLGFKLVAFSVLYKIFIVLAAVLSDYSAEDYDTSSQLLLVGNPHWVPRFLAVSMQSFVRWDAVHFLTIAHNNGYSFEQQFAFFPGLPILMRAVASTLLKPLELLQVDEISLLALSGVLISNISSVLAAWVLFRLTRRLFDDEHMAFVSSILYITTPTPLIMSSM